MPKYIITERQEKLLKEIYVASGKFHLRPVIYFYRYFFEKIFDKKKKKIFKLVRLFFKNELGVSLNKWDDDQIEFYLRDIKDNESGESKWDFAGKYSGVFKKPSTIVSLSYFLMKNLLEVYKFEGLEYVKQVDSPFTKFFFFDPEIQEFVGFVEARKSLSLPGKSMKVTLSAIEKEYIGRGYGARMYLCLINQVEYLMSDDTLYPDSLNMWVNYLPKKVNVWALVDELDSDDKNKFVKLSSKKFVNPNTIESLIASSVKTNPPNI